MHLFQPRVTDEMNAELCKKFSGEEIGHALFQMGPLKAPDRTVSSSVLSTELENHP
jgi:hypothetical protein